MLKDIKVQRIYPLSPMQEGMLFHTIISKDSHAYFEQMAYDIQGEIDLSIFEDIWNALIKKYDVFRTIFIYEELSKPMQAVLQERKTKLFFEDISAMTENAKEKYLAEYKERDKQTGFNLSKDVMIRVAAFKTGPDNHKIIWSHHHILMDGWSLGVVINDFFSIYRAVKENRPLQFKEVCPYFTYIKWLEKQDQETGYAYWREYLDNYEQQAILPGKTARNPNVKYCQSKLGLILDREITVRLTNITFENQVTINTIFQVIWGILLQRYNNTEDVVFGTVVSGRPSQIPGIESAVGLFINTIPVRINNAEAESFVQLLRKVQDNALLSEKHNYLSLAQIQSYSQLKNDLIDHIMVFENYPMDKEKLNQSFSEFNIEGLEFFEQTNYDFNIVIKPGDECYVSFEYNNAVYPEPFINRVKDHFINIINKIAKNPGIKLVEIDILNETERQQIIHEFNANEFEFPKDKTIQELFEAQAAKTPDQIALVYQDQQLTYHELNCRANQLARNLRGKRIQPDQIVGLMVERSPELIIGVLAILKSGGAYLPIDPEYPVERIKYMLDDSETQILLIQGELNHEISFNGEVVNIGSRENYQAEDTDLKLNYSSNNLAYIIYTSGSTGKPKGVMVEHRTVVNLIAYQIRYFAITADERIVQFSNITFDASVEQIFIALFSGAQLVLVPREYIMDPTQLHKYIIEKKCTHFHAVPSYLNTMQFNGCSSLKRIIAGGDVCSSSLVKKYHPEIHFYNEYGPTETTVTAIELQVKDTKFLIEKVPIGKPLGNVKVYILNKANQLQPVGILGELFIGGECLGRGYLKQPELTNERFVENPFQPGTKMYRTGDLARWLPDGNIEFSGRIDHQVKIRGYRIELGEIESRLLEHESIKDTVVIDRTDNQGNKYLCAYLTTSVELKLPELREYLSKKLPDYMMPSYFVKLEYLPLTSNGKIDRKALPEPDGSITGSRAYVGPANETEEKLLKIWQDVLRVERIGMNDDFFELGGHSLKATVLAAKIHQELQVNLPLKEIFKTSTIRGLAGNITRLEQSRYSAIQPVEEQEYYPVSAAQKRMYLLWRFEGDAVTYNAPNAVIIENEIDRNHIEACFKTLIARHETLRTSFELVEGEPLQRVHQTVDFAIEYLEFSEMEAGPENLREIIQGFIRPFDLGRAPLLRIKLARLKAGKHLLFFDIHHIISDGVSMGVLLKELAALSGNQELPVLRIQYKDFAVWQNELFLSESIKREEEYWLGVFDGELPVLNMPTDYPRPSVQSFAGNSINFEIEASVTEKLNRLAMETGTTMYMVLLAAYNILLAKYTGQEDIIIGSPIAARPHADLQNIIGMFINTLAMRSYPKGDKTFGQFLTEVKENALMAYENQDYQFEELIEKLNLHRDISRNPLFDTMFILQNMDNQELIIEGLKITPCLFEQIVSKFDLTLTATESASGIKFTMEYCTNLFKKETILRIVNHFIRTIREITENPQLKLAEIQMLSETEKQQILYTFNATETGYPKDKTIHELFETQVEKTPNHIAVVCQGQQLSYRELNIKANQLARILRSKGVQPDKIAGLMVDRTLEMIVGMLGILKAGGAYLPIDPEYPEERIKYMLEDSGTQVLLTQNGMNKIPSFPGEIININDARIYQEGNGSNVNQDNNSKNLAYVIYTSGSTGKPKGVMIEHQGVHNFFHGITNQISFKPDEAILALTTLSFDIHVLETLLPLSKGIKIVMTSPEEQRDPRLLKELIIQHKITKVQMTPSRMQLLLSETEDQSWLDGLQEIMIGGEAFPDILLHNLRKNYRGKIFNMYGPTETTVWSTVKDLTKAETINIGTPISNTQVYIVDKNYNLQPIGIPGELCIAGDGLARGYLKRPELTTEKFIPNRFNEGMKMYRTGDLARWLSDGNLEYLGRIDHQVKIRGYRIELGEIESRLLEHERIKEAVVIEQFDTQGIQYLCAYIVAELELTVTELREYLSRQLPEYMVPSYFVTLNQLPLTPNGKIDRKALPKPDNGVAGNKEYVAPVNELERQLVQIWQTTLRVKKIGTHDDFFELGGHSLKATVLVAKIHKELNVNLPVKELFKTPTIQALARYIATAAPSRFSAIQPVMKQEYYPVSSAQKRMYLLWRLEKDAITYNIPNAVIIENPIERNQLESQFKMLIARHETLRTSFELVDGEPVQRIHQAVDLCIEYPEFPALESGSNNLPEIISRFIQPFDLGRAPLLRVKLIKLKDEKHLLFLDMHHIISDGVSMGILLKELMELGLNRELPASRIQYKDFAVWQNERLQSEAIKSQEEYWLDVFNSEIPVLNIPSDYPRPTVQSFVGSSISFEIETSITEKLKRLAMETGATLYMVLLAVYNILLFKYSGQEDVVIGSPIAGRPHSDLQNIIGMFVNTLAMRNYPAGNKTFRQFLTEVKENALLAYEKQDYQFEELIEKLNLRRDISRNPLFDTMFVLQNMDGRETELDSLHITPYPLENKVAKFDLTLQGVEHEKGISLVLDYCTKLFKPETVERITKHLIQIIKEVVKDPEVKLSEIEMLSGQDKNQILSQFNDTRTDYPKNQTIQELFEEQVVKTPDHIALVYKDQQLTYEELNKRANQLARTLRNKEVKADSIIAIMVERSMEMLTGILGILKAGGAYLPIDPEYPEERIKFMLADSGANMLLTQSRLTAKYVLEPEIIDLNNEASYDADGSNLTNRNQPHDLAYVIYTSGSTGKPKGVMVEHQNVIRLVKNTNYIEFGANDRILQTGATVFDASTFEFWGSLLNGLRLHIVSEDVILNAAKLNKALHQYEITTLWLTSPLFNQLSQENPELFNGLKYLLVGGDVLSPSHINRVRRHNPNIQIINGYGPTENTTFSVCFKIDRDYEEKIPIGKPIANSTAYIVDGYSKLQPIGVAGELWVGGDGVGRGYLNREELTKEKFVADPFQSGSRIYKTGDLARWLPDGNIEFLGRIDQQVKIRGFRIELGEIESRLLEHEGIKEAIVIDRTDAHDNKYLCTYLVTMDELKVPELREYLLRELPDYMVPSYFIKLDKLPLNVNGKVDRKALPEPDGSISSGREYAAATNEIEETLVSIWQNILGEEKIGIRDNFFELGGDSIKGIQISARLNQYQLTMNLIDLFKNPTIEQLAKYMKYEESEISQETVTGEIGLTPVQRWFFEPPLTGRHHFNQSVMVYRKEGFDENVVRQIFDKILEHHDALRMIYRMDETQQILQYNRNITEGKLYDLRVIDLTDELDCKEKVVAEANQLQQDIDLTKGPLVKLGLFKTKEGDHLLIIIHHLVIDGVSWRILVEDLTIAYQSILENKEITLPPKTHSFKEWSQLLQQYVNSKEFLEEKEYWRQLESQTVTSLPGSASGTSHEQEVRRSLSIKLSSVETDQLLKQVNTAYHTEINDILLSALGLAIKKSTGQEKVLIQMEGHGREELIPRLNITRTIGWFTSIYPAILDMTGVISISDAIKQTKESLQLIPRHGIGYGILKYLTTLENKQEMEFRLNPGISFNYLGQFDQNVQTQILVPSKLPMGLSAGPELDKLKLPLEINGIVTDNELVFSFDFDTHEYQEMNIAILLKNFQTTLSDIIQHCVNREVSGLTAAGFEEFIAPSNKKTIENVINHNDRDLNELIMLLNSPKEKNLFAFPPIGAFGLAYWRMAQLFENHSFYTFDFIEKESRLSDYVKLITRIQPEGPYVLFGYSGGGNLAFEVAKELTKQRYQVSDLILLDPQRLQGNGNIPEEEKKQILEQSIEKYKVVSGFQENLGHVSQKIKSYLEYIDQLENTGIIDTNIHFIQSNFPQEDEKVLERKEKWVETTSRKFIKYQGFGMHTEMLDPGFINDNMELVNHILNGERR